MDSEISFGRVIRTSATARRCFPQFVGTVEQAIDYIQELPLATWRSGHWHSASLSLWDAVDFPQDAARLTVAVKDLCAALAVEGWLDEIPPA